MILSELMKERTLKILVTFIYIVLFFIAGRNLIAETLWFDESGQFFISKGLNHFSPPFSSEGGLYDVVYNNARYNQDPGFFSIILFFWSKVSNSIIWLRVLPFTFFCLAILFTGLVVKRLTSSSFFALLSGLLLFLVCRNNDTYLLRAYSMELLCASFGLWSFFFVKSKICLSRLIIVSIVMTILMGSRYSAIIITFVYSCYICYFILKSQLDNKTKLLYLIMFGLPLLLGVLFIFTQSTMLQNPGMVKLPHNVSLRSDLFPIFGITGMMLWILVLLSYKTFKHNNDIFIFISIVLSVLFLFIILSLKGSMPFNIKDKHCGSILYFFCIAIFTLSSILIKHTLSNFYIVLATICFSISTSYVECNNRILHGFKSDNFYRLIPELRKIDMSSYSKVYVPYFTSPTIKYYYEYYADEYIRMKDCYPSNFQFVHSYEHCISKGQDPLWRFRQTELNQKKDIENLPTNSLILGPYQMLVPMEHESFVPLCPIEGTWEIYVKD